MYLAEPCWTAQTSKFNFRAAVTSYGAVSEEQVGWLVGWLTVGMSLLNMEVVAIVVMMVQCF